MTLIYLTYWYYKYEIIYQISEFWLWWDEIKDCVYKRRSEFYAKFILITWLITGIADIILMTSLQLKHPGSVGFMSSYFASNLSDTSDIPNWIHFGSVTLHLLMLIYYFFGNLIGDVMPIIFCLAYKVSFQRLAEIMVEKINIIENITKTETGKS